MTTKKKMSKAEKEAVLKERIQENKAWLFDCLVRFEELKALAGDHFHTMEYTFVRDQEDLHYYKGTLGVEFRIERYEDSVNNPALTMILNVESTVGAFNDLDYRLEEIKENWEEEQREKQRRKDAKTKAKSLLTEEELKLLGIS